jgi:Protein of unknown function (DUF2505)
MRRIRQSLRLPCTPETFWRVFFDEMFVRRLYLDALGFPGFEMLERQGDTRKLRVVPKLGLPEVLERLIGGAFAYEEHGALDRETNQWTWTMVRPKGSGIDLVGTRGTVKIVSVDEGSCTRIDEITIEGKLFGLGSVIEAAAEKEARSAWAKEERFVIEWLRRGEA